MKAYVYMYVSVSGNGSNLSYSIRIDGNTQHEARRASYQDDAPYNIQERKRDGGKTTNEYDNAFSILFYNCRVYIHHEN